MEEKGFESKCLQASFWLYYVQYIWWIRKELKHGNQPKTDEKILQKIKWEVRARILGKGKSRTEGNERICCKWGTDKGILV
jgi:hypothetical protein